MFIKVKEYVINASSVRDFALNDAAIRVHYNNGDAITIIFESAEKAARQHDDIYRILNGKPTNAEEEFQAKLLKYSRPVSSTAAPKFLEDLQYVEN